MTTSLFCSLPPLGHIDELLAVVVHGEVPQLVVQHLVQLTLFQTNPL